MAPAVALDPDLPEPSLDAALPGASMDSDTALAAAALTAGTAPAHGHGHGPIHTHCENCGAKLEGPYCHRCGQHDFEFHRSFRHVALEALESFFHFEGKFFRNIVTLMFWPGRLTAEFNAGKRAAQMPPFRLYVFVSLVFFFLIFLGGASESAVVQLDDTTATPGADAEQRQKLGAAIASVAERAKSDPALKAKLAELEDEFEALPQPGKAEVITQPGQNGIRLEGGENDAFLRWLETTVNHLTDPGYRAKLADTFVHNIPRLLLVCLPLFALYTRVLFRGSGQVYLQHLVLALHFHAFVYLWILFRDGWEFLAGLVSPTLAGFVWTACMLWALVYPLLMLRELFHNSWRRTSWKALVLTLAYLATLAAGFLVVFFAVLATL